MNVRSNQPCDQSVDEAAIISPLADFEPKPPSAATPHTSGMTPGDIWSSHLPPTASARLVNRTHRVVRERAASLQARRRTVRSLWIPLAVSSGLLLVIVCTIWSVLDEYDVTPNGLPDANQQLLVLMVWCLPISIGVLAVVWFRRGGTRNEGVQ